MRHPLLYQLNTRIYLLEQAREQATQPSFDNIPEALLNHLAELGFEWLYLLGIWQTGPLARAISQSDPQVWSAGQVTLPDFSPADIIGSPFAIQAYTPNRAFGDLAALQRLRKRARARGLKLILDFVPNHIGPDHDWVATHPEYLISGTEEDVARDPQNWGRFETPAGPRIFAFGRDPYFSGWRDTVQLNYRHPECRRAMIDQLSRVAELCDGVRGDMAMLIEPDIFLKTWGERSIPGGGVAPSDVPFWPEAIAAVRKDHPAFSFIAEVYWDMEWRLQQEGFDFTYDKRLYDRLHAGMAAPVREHLMAEPDFQRRSARFLENHDEPRVAGVFPSRMHFPAALLAFFSPGLRFFHEGQFEGWRTHISMHLGRRKQEPRDPNIHAFYQLLLQCLCRPEVHDGQFRLWQPQPAWQGNPTSNNFVCFSWHDAERQCSLIVVNYSDSQGQCYVPLGLDFLTRQTFRLRDLLGTASYDRLGNELKTRGLYLDLPPWGYHFFDLSPVEKPASLSNSRVDHRMAPEADAAVDLVTSP